MNNVDKLDMMSVCLYAEELGEEWVKTGTGPPVRVVSV
jgi:hypothetical protein